MKYIFLAFIIAFTTANLLVNHFGAYGLWFSSGLLIPFDFIARCIIHEKYRGAKLVLVLFALCFTAAVITYLLNAPYIAAASMAGFTAAQLGAGIFYQSLKQKTYFVKVNGSDLIAIIFDSIVFQFIAFGSLNLLVTGGQIVIKFLGGLLWYFILFKKLKLHEYFNRL